MAQIKPLSIGDKIGFVTIGANIEDADAINFYAVVEITTRDGERAYKYAFPDGTVSSAAFAHSRLDSHMIRIERRPDKRMICLTDQPRAVVQGALKRSFENEFEVFGDWYRDTYVVVNKTKNTEYRVELETIGKKAYASCTCKDFQYRKQACKHVMEVMQFTFFVAAV